MRVMQYGLGAMGGLMVKLLAAKPDATIVGAVDRDAAKIGRDVGEAADIGCKLGARPDRS